MRIPSDLLDEIDRKAAEVGISRNDFLNQCIRFALLRIGKADNEGE